ncbi:Protein CBG18019 [Caenorhabditis briggsae]|uniref:Protein CBG18019 n=1 Tax=Caenorhabditis briggsae TaxID=6238 RepID=A8XSU4_CAEBR|nr:Protein CBG18019 [Caenorhabditis briggsae]CAP35547.1 Protein CBG18019 [Caenorhabditis briggsae]
MLHHRNLLSFCSASAHPLPLCAPLDYCPTSAQPWIKVGPQPNSPNFSTKVAHIYRLLSGEYVDGDQVDLSVTVLSGLGSQPRAKIHSFEAESGSLSIKRPLYLSSQKTWNLNR